MGGWWLVCSLMMTTRALRDSVGPEPLAAELDGAAEKLDLVDLVEAADDPTAFPFVISSEVLGFAELASEIRDEVEGEALSAAAAVVLLEPRPAQATMSGWGFSSMWTVGRG